MSHIVNKFNYLLHCGDMASRLHPCFNLDEENGVTIEVSIGGDFTITRSGGTEEHNHFMSKHNSLSEEAILEEFLKGEKRGLGCLFDHLRRGDTDAALKLVSPYNLKKIGGWEVRKKS